MTTSSSFGNVMTAEPCRSGIVVSLSLQFIEVVLDPIQSVVDRSLVLGDPVVQGAKSLGSQAVEPASAVGPAPDEAHFTENSEVPRDLRLTHRDFADDRPDLLLTFEQNIEDCPAVDVTEF